MDKIIIEELQIYAYHGVYTKENETGQNFYINAQLETDTRSAGVMDDLELSTNYGEVCRFLHSFVTEHTYKLIETVAERAAEAAACLSANQESYPGSEEAGGADTSALWIGIGQDHQRMASYLHSLWIQYGRTGAVFKGSDSIF